ncbi:hypothetical protein B0H21DRAFT_97581 [Amylocystis lapponica]|nr:hypothetical protein B0H21DRAFT_97581 [Amylocystis lapponica]
MGGYFLRPFHLSPGPLLSHVSTALLLPPLQAPVSICHGCCSSHPRHVLFPNPTLSRPSQGGVFAPSLNIYYFATMQRDIYRLSRWPYKCRVTVSQTRLHLQERSQVVSGSYRLLSSAPSIGMVVSGCIAPPSSREERLAVFRFRYRGSDIGTHASRMYFTFAEFAPPQFGYSATAMLAAAAGSCTSLPVLRHRSHRVRSHVMP